MRNIILLLFVAVLASCDKDDTAPVPPPPPPPISLLKDVVLQALPSPYYHFEYDQQKRYAQVSHKSGLSLYEVTYENNLLKKMKNNSPGNKDLIEYDYDADNRVTVIRIKRENGTLYRRGFLTYDTHNRLQELEWEVALTGGAFAQEQTMTFTYDANSNLSELRDHRHAIDGIQPEAVYIDTYEQYDRGVNVDDFSLLHLNDRHVVLLPGVRLQMNNPGKVTRTGDGINYYIFYTYQYNSKNHPTRRDGDMRLANGQQSHLVATYSYYE